MSAPTRNGLYPDSAFLPPREEVRGTPAEAARDERFAASRIPLDAEGPRPRIEPAPVVMGVIHPWTPTTPEHEHEHEHEHELVPVPAAEAPPPPPKRRAKRSPARNTRWHALTLEEQVRVFVALVPSLRRIGAILEAL